MKVIMISIKPKWVAKILNGEKTIEVRKLFPKDYKGWVYIYCTKSQIKEAREYFTFEELPRLGKVVGRFYCDKVEEFYPFFHWCIEKETCLTRDEVLDYLDNKDKNVWNPKRQDKVYAIHISALQIFDKPKELSEFKIYCDKLSSIWDSKCDRCRRVHIDYEGYLNRCDRKLTKAPQNYCYVEDFK